MEKQKKISFWQRILISIKDFDGYKLFAIEHIFESIKYLLKIVLLLVLVASLCSTYNFSRTVNNIKQKIDENVNTLEFKDNTLSINNNEVLFLEMPDLLIELIIADTRDIEESKINEYTEKLGKHNNAILVLKDKLILKNSVTNINTTYDYKDIAKNYRT